MNVSSVVVATRPVDGEIHPALLDPVPARSLPRDAITPRAVQQVTGSVGGAAWARCDRIG